MSNPFGDMGGLSNMLGGFQSKMKEIQSAAEEADFTASAGGDLVTVTVKGSMKVISVSIRDGAEDDKELLEDLITVATNKALTAAKNHMSEEMSNLTAGLPIPPGMLGL